MGIGRQVAGEEPRDSRPAEFAGRQADAVEDDEIGTDARGAFVEERRQHLIDPGDETGPGIDPQDRDRLFDPLFTTKPGSMGLGLPICRTIIEAHGGRIWATPGIGHGTVLQFALPAGSIDV